MSIRRIHWLGMVCLFGSLVVICSAFLSEVLPQGRLDEIKKSITKINQLLSDSQKEKLSLLSTIQMSRSQLDYRTELISELNKQNTHISTEIINLEKNNEKDVQKIDHLKVQLSAIWRMKWKHICAGNTSLVSGADQELSDKILKWYWINQWEQIKGQQLRQLKVTLHSYFSNKDRLQQKRDSVANMVSQLSAEKLNLASDLDKSSILMRSMVNKEADLKAELAGFKMKQEKLEAIVLKSICSNSSNEANNSAGSHRYSSEWQFPVTGGTIISRFGKTAAAPNIYTNNNGIDVQTNDPFVSVSNDAEVIQIARLPNDTYMVLTRVGEIYTVYSQLESVLVRQKEWITRGMKIGKARSNEKGAFEMHFEIWKGKTPQNPLNFVN
ncbi:MAG: peptidoglycan DD-metalloendopeptidase family protein [Saprospiraceae bacterium]|nr:peptidoglycan DD-metalloendopeptidase family protein [Saprospiraceae bacterium]MBK7795779.1 peptidoglycan DD-metalloendopeptidase family protein [Saprospiraceae bacterium]MBL0260893.1 peptidoglycan DD-metalloendopeptidase family protein [Saprospiraceae bacterium]